ncbi:MAG: hypothetical protein HQK79_12055 [Desulfobacterales bacterium]|nr:hypothetical protein [Desulfobacterales bacterium]
MDNLSGGAFGIYLTTYFWFLMGIRWITIYFHAGNVFLFPFIVGPAVLVENLIALGSTAFLERDLQFQSYVTSLIFSQFLLALITGPIFFIFIQKIHKKFDKLIYNFTGGKNANKK